MELYGTLVLVYYISDKSKLPGSPHPLTPSSSFSDAHIKTLFKIY
jgi:hypothetical protein